MACYLIMSRQRRLAPSTWILPLILAFAITGCGVTGVSTSNGSPSGLSTSNGSPLGLAGTVYSGQQPVTGALIQLYAVGSSGDGSAATPLLSTVVTSSDGSGNAASASANPGNSYNSLPSGAFTIAGEYHCPAPDTEVYLTARGGNPGVYPGASNSSIAMMAALGPCGSLSSSTYISINELTTVASIVPLVGYMSGYSAIGSGMGDLPGLRAGFSAVNQYADISHGTVPGTALPQGYSSSSVQLATLANVLAACINSSGGVAGDGSACGSLFSLTTPAGGAAPTDTIGAALSLLKHPLQNVAAIYRLAGGVMPFVPALTTAPASWRLPIFPVNPPLTFSAGLNDSTIFIGASIVQAWPMPLHNAGVFGQTTPQVLARFQSAVVGHGYARVVILVGSNDILQSLPGIPDEAVANITAMARIARDAGMEVVLSQLPPLLPPLNASDPQLQLLNAGIANVADSNGYLLVDYHTPMSGHPEYFTDGLHPTAAGYTVMERALAAVVTQ